ncbi:MAG: class I SAM-dependent methyltransferase, partial [Crenarchaeota archaeon]|nr:class I SAM-dependent methyltransferase [Thermoproteota archaeon]
MSTAPVFDELWSRYDSWYERNRILAENELEAVKALGLQGRGVEVGVGTGWFASRLGVEFGVDPSLGMLRLARLRGVEAVQGVGERLPLRSGSMDYVLLIVTLCFVDDPLAALREAARVARPGGAVAACIVPRDSSWGRFYQARRSSSPFYRVARFYTVDEVEQMMR